MVNRRRFLAALAGAGVPLVRTPRGFGQSFRPAPRRWSAVQDVLDAHVARRTVAGAVTALSYADAPLTYLAAGRIALDSDRPPDENSIYRMYSTTKVVTGIAAMKLVQDGKLRLGQPVTDVIPEWKSLRVAIDAKESLESRPVRTTMTMRHLLTHTSGLAYWIPSAGSDLLPSMYRERGITPGDYGIRGVRPGYGPQAKTLSEMIGPSC
jgi:CubicO group peptidase (beta-lactamase class C family)